MTDFIYKDSPIPQRRPDPERRVKSPDELFGPDSGIYRGMPPGADKGSRKIQRSELEFEAGLNRVQPDRGTVTGTAVPGPGTSWKSRARVFYEQAQEYAGRESDAHFEGVFRRYYPTYADLPEQVLEGYFGWRTRARRKEWEKAPFAFIYLYGYEIFTQAGIALPEEGYRILKEIDEHYGLERPARPDKGSGLTAAQQGDMQTEAASQSFFGGTDSLMLHIHLGEWMRDYCAYFNLGDPWRSECFGKQIDGDRYLSILRQADNSAEGEHVRCEEFFEALEALSSFSPKSGMYKKHPEECMELLVRICRALSGYFRNTAHRTLYEYCFGQQEREVHRMFENAVFWDFKNYSDYRYQIDDIRSYICRNGSWQLEGPAGDRTQGRNSAVSAWEKAHKMNGTSAGSRNDPSGNASGRGRRPAHRSSLLGDFLQEAERQMRETYGVKPALKQKTYNENIVAVIGDAIRSYQKEQEDARKPKITIDFSRLSAIRSDADITAGRLLEGSEEESVLAIEENAVDQVAARLFKEDTALQSVSITEDSGETAGRAETSVLLDSSPSVRDGAAIPAQAGTSDSPLSAEEAHFLRLVLDGGDYLGYARSIHAFPSVMADGINEKLFDYLSDMALEDDGSGHLTVVEDYTEDIRDLLG